MDNSKITLEVQHGEVEPSQCDGMTTSSKSAATAQNGARARRNVKPPSLVEEKCKSAKGIKKENGPSPQETLQLARDHSGPSSELVSTQSISLFQQETKDSAGVPSSSHIQVRDDKRNEDENIPDQDQQAIRSEAPPRNQVSIPNIAADVDVEAHCHVRHPWPLFSSPKTPVQNEDDGRRPSKPNCNGETTKPTARENRGYNPSPPNGWPQRSPIKTDHAHMHEEASFTLFNHSFDTLSETGQVLREIGLQQDGKSSTPPSNPPDPRAWKQQSRPPRKIDLTIGAQNSSDCSTTGDISPIKLVDQTNDGRDRHRRADPYQPADFRPKTNHLPNQMPCMMAHGHGFPHPVAPPVTPYGIRQLTNLHRFSQDDHYGMRTRTGPLEPNPFFVLRAVQKAFRGCSYLLSCLCEADVCPINLSHYGNIRHYRQNGEADPYDIVVATRRVEAAICAFGGYLQPKQPSNNRATSIFRFTGQRKSPAKEFYEQRFHQRYYVGGYHVSWEVEEDPPVHLEAEDLSAHGHPNSTGENGSTFSNGETRVASDHSSPHDGNKASTDSISSSTGSVVPSENQQKMKYRCKLCGQLKQNHNCPYQQSLQRSIAVMVHPAVNAFSACEPGRLTKPLSQMNNFVSYDAGKTSPGGGGNSDPGTAQRRPLHITHVTPETKSRSCALNSPQSSLSTHSPDASPLKKSDPGSLDGPPSRHFSHVGRVVHGSMRDHQTIGSTTRKRPHVNLVSGVGPGDFRARNNSSAALAQFPFVPSLQLRHEHYRAVTRKFNGVQQKESDQGFQYPHVPQTFAERKKLSDTLFYLSNEIPVLNRDVAGLLRRARECEEWDLAVAEILTQVVVSRYCGEGDHRLDGLQQYLLRIGISC